MERSSASEKDGISFLQSINYVKLSIYSFVALLIGIIFGPFIFPMIIRTGMRMV